MHKSIFWAISISQGASGNLPTKLSHTPSSLAYNKLDIRPFAPTVSILIHFKVIKWILVAGRGSASPIRMPSEGIQNAEGHLLHLLTLIQLRWGDCFLDCVTSVWWRLLATAEPPFLPTDLEPPPREIFPHHGPWQEPTAPQEARRHYKLMNSGEPTQTPPHRCREMQLVPCGRGTWGLDMTPFQHPDKPSNPETRQAWIILS